MDSTASDVAPPLGVKLISGLVGVFGVLGILMLFFYAIQFARGGRFLLTLGIALLILAPLVLIVGAIDFWKLSSRGWWIIFSALVIELVLDMGSTIDNPAIIDIIGVGLTLSLLAYLLYRRDLYS